MSYSHWQGRLLDEAESTDLRRWQREDGQVLQAECCALLSRKWDVCPSSSRGVAHATVQARSSRVEQDRSGCGRDTDATRFLAGFLDGAVMVLRGEEEKSGRGWRRLPQKVEARGGATIVGRNLTRPMREPSPTAKGSQLDDWPDSPEMLTKRSAAAAPLPALTRTGLEAGRPRRHLGFPSAWRGRGLAPCSIAH